MPSTPQTDPQDVAIRDEMIRLGQFLKLAGVAEDGIEVKALLAEAAVTVNGEIEARRGRQLNRGDVIGTETPAGWTYLRVSG
ncbi:RNA-binding S4 domain-containing protein [Pseudactinotalea sp. Z1748]|uniref:RNA-binding S4 domain-containing protein n=1 Tax=Pseudactinotalea sp. Z1748 TaxID=3413027 RepID=UPI003C7D37AB